MMVRAARAPGLAVEVQRPAPDPSPLRSDVAAFVGPTRRGPVGVPVRIEGWRDYQRVFGGLAVARDTTYAVRGYFENGGEVAWIVRTGSAGMQPSRALWSTRDLRAVPWDQIVVEASSPGDWSANASVQFTYRGRTATGQPTVDVDVRSADEREQLRGLPASSLVAAVNAVSQLIRLKGDSLRLAVPATPRAFLTDRFVLAPPTQPDAPASADDYVRAVEALGDVPEVALLGFPEIYDELGEADATSVLRAAVQQAEDLRDRLVLVDLPRRAPRLRWHADEVASWVAAALGRGAQDLSGEAPWWRAAALYHPWLRVADPLGGVARPSRDIAPSGHVAGVISRLDRERGAHATPANAPFRGVIDLREEYEDEEHALLNALGVDLVRCVPSLGFSVWGGRTLHRQDRFVAHRRLLHRLVRAIRRVAEPLTFEVNGPALWFAFVRAITAVLLAAWRSGALVGGRPDEAFQVVCDATTNPPEQIEQGLCVCSVRFAPAVPMEFILVRIALSRDGALEVLT